MSGLQNLSFRNIDIKPRCTIDVEEGQDNRMVSFKVVSIKYRPQKLFPYELVLFGIEDNFYHIMYCGKFGDVVYKDDKKRIIGNIKQAYNYYVKPINVKNINNTNYGEF